MKRESCIALLRFVAAVTMLMLAWLVTPAVAQHLSLDASSSLMGCGVATNIGHANIAPLYVDGNPCISPSFPVNNANILYTNIKICAPGNKTNCQVIDHVEVDTGSVGLRIASSAVPNLLQALPYVPTSSGKILTSCATFGDGSLLYGPVQTADVYIADKFVKNFPVQIYGQTPPVPGCGQNAFQAPADKNGLIGIRFLLSQGDIYYSCNTDGSSCQPGPSTTTPNPISKFQNDNNGVTIALSTIPPSGSTEPVLGLLIFGVGTQADNTPPEGTVPLVADSNPADPNFGTINLYTSSNSTPTPAIIDSGTSFLAINDPSLPSCSNGFYCPPVPPPDCDPTDNTIICLGLSSSGATTPAYSVDYTIGNADNLIPSANGDNIAFNDLADPSSAGISSILGLSFFFGKTMYFVFVGQPSPLGTGPIDAMSPQGTLTTASQ